jgi:hypothetical protein
MDLHTFVASWYFMYRVKWTMVLTCFETCGRLFRTVGAFCSFKECNGGFNIYICDLALTPSISKNDPTFSS